MTYAVQLACTGCGAALGERGFEPVEGRCRCSAGRPVRVDARGATDAPRPSLSLLNLAEWVRGVRQMMTGSVVCAGACPSCNAPLMVEAAAPLRLRCDRCGSAREVAAGSAIASPIDGLSCGLNATFPGKGSFDLQYTIERAEAASLGGHACPQCGGPVPPGHAADACSYCRAPLWMVDREGRRYTYVLHIAGRRSFDRVDQRVPLSQAEAATARDVDTFRSATGMMKGIGMGVLVIFGVIAGIALLCVGGFFLLMLASGGD